jgi:hypothetical protein
MLSYTHNKFIGRRGKYVQNDPPHYGIFKEAKSGDFDDHVQKEL